MSIISNRSLLYFLAVLRLPFYKRGYTLKDNPKSFVVINQTGNIGDMVCTTPVFRAIKKAYPKTKLVVVGAPKNELMLSGNPDVDEYIAVTNSYFSVARQLRAMSIEAGVDINFSPEALSMMLVARVPAISCFEVSKSKGLHVGRMFRLLSQKLLQLPYTPGTYVPGQYLTLLEPYGIEDAHIQKYLYYTDECIDGVKQFLVESGVDLDKPLIAIAPGAGTKIKQWPAERFGAVANHLAEKHDASILIIGGPNDAEEAQVMIDALNPSVRYANCIEQTLEELKAVLALPKMIIGNDSGPIYIAEAHGAATLVLVGPTDESEHPLQDKTHKVVIAKDRGAALLQSAVSGEDTIDLDLAKSQIESITVEEVTQAADELMGAVEQAS